MRQLECHGYVQAKHTSYLFSHISRSVSFTLIVDDFGIKYTRHLHAEHFLATSAIYTQSQSTGQAGDKYIGFTIKLDRPNRRVHLSMPGYIRKVFLERFGIEKPSRPVNAPTRYIPPSYGTRVQTPCIDITSGAQTPYTGNSRSVSLYRQSIRLHYSPPCSYKGSSTPDPPHRSFLCCC